ncbi:MAG TPA: 16S rRNA (cytidine(1402)-2'-O)-methyltransferase [Vicinamibacterales bacterium]|nr:16S rRNA (cytidine(1402)-2'-O)-methyltransferase [Vicinamibacterales bacterium]
MPGILYVVATPIGNLEDVTLRALRILREVALIAAEDTRRTAKLLQHYSISTPTTSLHEHNEHAKTPALIARLGRGDSIALVSDAGTPAVSDPGARLVAAAHLAGVAVQPVPGPSAVLAAVSASGLATEGFTFLGFPPNRAKARKSWLHGLADHEFALVIYESPHRIQATLTDIASELGDRTVAIGREMTKIHENLAVRPIATWLKDPPPEQGEFVLVIFPSSGAEATNADARDPRLLAREFWHVTKTEALGRREALRQVARRFGVSTRTVFAAVEAHPESVE